MQTVDYAAPPTLTNVRGDSGAMRSRATAANHAAALTLPPTAVRRPCNSAKRRTSFSLRR